LFDPLDGALWFASPAVADEALDGHHLGLGTTSALGDSQPRELLPVSARNHNSYLTLADQPVSMSCYDQSNKPAI
jgi:hypothetical protein